MTKRVYNQELMSLEKLVLCAPDTTQIDNLDYAELHKMVFMQSYLVTGFLQESPPLFL